MTPSLLVFLKPNEKMFTVKKHTVKRDQSLALYFHVSIQHPESPLPNKHVLLETGPAHAEAAPFPGDQVRQMFLCIPSTLDYNPGALTAYSGLYGSFMWLQSQDSLDGQLHQVEKG